MEGQELKFKYVPQARKWVSWFVCPLKLSGSCEECGRIIKSGERVYLNFDNGKRYCETHRELAYTDFVQYKTGA